MTTVNPSDLTAEHFTRVIKAQPSDSINGMECNGEKTSYNPQCDCFRANESGRKLCADNVHAATREISEAIVLVHFSSQNSGSEMTWRG